MKRTIYKMSPFKISGILKELKADYISAYHRLYTDFGEAVHFSTPLNLMLLYHPDDVNYVLKKNAKNYVKPKSYKHFNLLIGDGIITSEGEKWARSRRILGPSFSPIQIRRQQELFLDQIEVWMHQFENKSNQEIDLNEVFYDIVFKIIVSILFGDKQAISVKGIIEPLDRGLEFILTRMYSLFSAPLWVNTPGNKAFKRDKDHIDNLLFDLINQSKNSKEDNQRFSGILNTLTHLNDETLSDSELRDELITLLLSGHETTTSGLVWIMFCIGKDQELKNFLYEDICLKGSESELLDAVICETFRLYPPVPRIDREAIEADYTGVIEIPTHTEINLNMYVTQRHPEFWENSEVFDYKRFLGKEASELYPGSYFPFALGKRSCIGEFMAKFEIKLIISEFLKKYDFEKIELRKDMFGNDRMIKATKN